MVLDVGQNLITLENPGVRTSLAMSLVEFALLTTCGRSKEIPCHV